MVYSDDQPPPAGTGAGEDDAYQPVFTSEDLENFRFTFNCSSTGSGKDSYIEPDVRPSLSCCSRRGIADMSACLIAQLGQFVSITLVGTPVSRG